MVCERTLYKYLHTLIALTLQLVCRSTHSKRIKNRYKVLLEAHIQLLIVYDPRQTAKALSDARWERSSCGPFHGPEGSLSIHETSAHGPNFYTSPAEGGANEEYFYLNVGAVHGHARNKKR